MLNWIKKILILQTIRIKMKIRKLVVQLISTSPLNRTTSKKSIQMKNTLLIILSICLQSFIADAQEISSQIIATSGQDNITSNISCSWTLGDIAIKEYHSNAIILSQGFQQSYLLINNISESNKQINCDIYPNPTTDKLFVLIKDEQLKDISVALYSAMGLPVWTKTHITGSFEIDFLQYPTGNYFLSISDNKNVSTFKITHIK